MALRDFFLPKIAHSNPDVRKQAVIKESDVNLLKRVLENDQDSAVREMAKRRLQELEAEVSA